MGREIRRVPGDWSHPCYTRDDAPYPDSVGSFRPLHDLSYADAVKDGWLEEYDDGELDPRDFVPDWTEAECTHYQYYENVSEGTPLSPPMPSLDALAEWLSTNRDYWGYGPLTRKQADAFCKAGYAPSFIIHSGGLTRGVEFDMEDL